MTESNAERVRRAYDAFTRGEMGPLQDFIDPTFEVEDHVTPEASPTERGLEALLKNAAHVYEAFGELTWDPVEIEDHGSQVLVRVRLTGKGQSTELPIDEDVANVFTLNDEGRATKLVIYRTWEEAQSAGASR